MRDLIEVYVRLRPEDIAYLKFVFESYETVGFLRTVDPKAATLVVFLVPDFAEEGLRILDSVSREIEIERIAPPADLGDDWLVGAISEAGSDYSDELPAATGGSVAPRAGLPKT